MNFLSLIASDVTHWDLEEFFFLFFISYYFCVILPFLKIYYYQLVYTSILHILVQPVFDFTFLRCIVCKCLWSFRSLKSQGHLVCLPSILISGLRGVHIGRYLTVFYPPIPLHPAILLLSKINSQSYRPVHKQFFVHFARPLQQLHVFWRQKLFKQIYDRYTRVPLYIIQHSRYCYSDTVI